MVELEKSEDKLINGDLSGTSPKLSHREHARVARKSDWRFGQKRGKKREFTKFLLIWKLFTYSSVQKKENWVSLTRLNYQTA
jgi:hypothetical protein